MMLLGVIYPETFSFTGGNLEAGIGDPKQGNQPQHAAAESERRAAARKQSRFSCGHARRTTETGIRRGSPKEFSSFMGNRVERRPTEQSPLWVPRLALSY